MRNSRAVFPPAVTAKRPARIAPLLAAVAVGLAGLSSPHAADAQTVVSNDFEDGTSQGWIPRGSAVLTNTTEAANTGTHSLKTTGRTAGFNGPSLNLLGVLSPGTPYQVTVAVRLASGEPATQLIVTVQRTPSGRHEPVRPRRRERGHRGHRWRVGDAAGLLQLRGRRDRPAALRGELEPHGVLLHRRLQHRRRAGARLLGPTGQLGHPHELRDGHDGGLGSAHRTGDGRGHDRRRARRRLQSAHHRPPGRLRRSRDQRRRQAVQRLALRRQPLGQDGARSAHLPAEGQHSAHARRRHELQHRGAGTRPSPPTSGCACAPPTTSSSTTASSRCTWNRRVGRPPSTSTTST